MKELRGPWLLPERRDERLALAPALRTARTVTVSISYRGMRATSNEDCRDKGLEHGVSNNIGMERRDAHLRGHNPMSGREIGP